MTQGKGQHDIERKLAEIFRRVFDDAKLEWSRELSSVDLPRWDARHNEQLLLEVQREFRVRFRAAEAAQLKNAGDLADAVHARLSGEPWP